MSLAARPLALGLSVKCTSLEDVNNILHELGWLDSLEKSIEAETKTKIDKLKELAKERLAFTITDDGGTDVPVNVEQRRADLVKKVTAWADRHLEENLPAGARSITLAQGTIGYRLAPMAVAFNDGCTEKTVIAAVEKKAGLLVLVSATLNTLVSRLPLSSLVRLKTELNKDGIKALWANAKKPVRNALIAFGLKVTGGEDALYLEPTKHVTADAA
jgi:hypothetical protein